MLVCLLIEDAAIAVDLAQTLRHHQVDVITAPADAEGLHHIRSPDIIVVQQSRSWFGGNHIIATIHEYERLTHVPIVVIGARDEVLEVVVLTLGADEFMAWPTSPEIFMARLRAIHHRRNLRSVPPKALTDGPIRVDLLTNKAFHQDEPLPLNGSEFAMLREIIVNGERITQRAQLAGALLGPQADSRDRRIDVHISALRKKLGTHRHWLHTIRAVGFAWRDPKANK